MISFPMEPGLSEADADKIARLTDAHGNACFEAVVAVRHKLSAYPSEVQWRAILNVLIGMLAKHLAPYAQTRDVGAVTETAAELLHESIVQELGQGS